MDPITQGALGAAVVQAVMMRTHQKPQQQPKWLTLLGAAGGMAADLDIFIRSSTDPLLNIVFHRHFTHSLAFIPIGGVLVALPFLLRRSLRARWRSTLTATTIGYATHALLDAFTTYGTQLSLPFSDYRTAFSLISIIDPLFTLPLLAGVVLGLKQRHSLWCQLGLLWGVFVLSFGAVQRQRASSAVEEVAAARGHIVERSAVFPSFANNITWRALYQSGGYVYVDAITVPWLSRRCVTTGSRVAIVTHEKPVGATGQRGLQLMRWFANDWVARSGDNDAILGDLRYSFRPSDTQPIWGVRLLDAEGAAISSHQLGQTRTETVEWIDRSRSRRVQWSDFAALFSAGQDANCGSNLTTP